MSSIPFPHIITSHFKNLHPLKFVSKEIIELTDIHTRYQKKFGSNKKVVIIMSGPSGAGKDSICDLLDQTKFSKVRTATTRAKRAGEPEESYYWLSREEFQQLLSKDAFIEHNNYTGDFYGTWREKVSQIFTLGKIPIFRIDPNGAKSLLKLQQNGERLFQDVQFLYFFVVPPKFYDLHQRLLKRELSLKKLLTDDDKERIQKRFHKARDDLSQMNQSHYIVINKNLKSVSREIERLINYCIYTQTQE